MHTFYKIITLLLFCNFYLLGQSSQQLINKRLELIKDIESINISLDKTKEQKNSILNEINILEQQIDNYQSLLTTIQEEKEVIQEDNLELNSEKTTLDSNKEKIYAEYSSLLRMKVRDKIQYNSLKTLFSAKSLKEYLVKLQLLKYFESKVMNFSNQVVDINNEEIKVDKQLTSNQIKRDTLSNLEVNTKEKLKAEKNKLTTLAGKLTLKERDLLTKLDLQKSEREKLNIDIENSLINEMNQATPIVTTVVSQPKTTTNNSNQVVQPSHTVLQPNKTIAQPASKIRNNIYDRRGFLPSPINGSIIKRYEPSKSSYSITMEGNIKDAVKVIYRGLVTNVGDYSITIDHSDGISSVYSNLTPKAFAVGQNVNGGEVIGTLSGQTLVFKIIEGDQTQNPIHWLKNN